MKIEPIGYVNECEDYTMSIIKATRSEHSSPVAVYTETQMRQAMEACAAIADEYEIEAPGCVVAIRNAIKEILG